MTDRTFKNGLSSFLIVCLCIKCLIVSKYKNRDTTITAFIHIIFLEIKSVFISSCFIAIIQIKLRNDMKNVKGIPKLKAMAPAVSSAENSAIFSFLENIDI